jgi:Arc/MetJ-type ribon-helix-helix transcriptional regulator
MARGKKRAESEDDPRKLELISIRIEEGDLREMDRLVEEGYYLDRSEVVRDAIRKLLRKQLEGT